MHIFDTSIKEVKIIEPLIFNDDRGFFYESFNCDQFNKLLNLNINFVQDNHSLSKKGTLRGIHYQVNNASQAKLVRVIRGAIFDCAIDLRHGSASFKKWVSVELSATNKKQLWIPSGFGHAFLALEDNTEVLYKTDKYYSKSDERTIIWNDKDININWPDINQKYLISEKDNQGSLLKNAEIF